MGRTIYSIFNIKIRLLLIAILLLSIFSHNVNSIDEYNSTFIENFSNTISESFQNALSKAFYVPLNALFSLFDIFLGFDVDIKSLKELWNIVVSIIIPLFIISIAYNGYCMIFNSHSSYKLYKYKNGLKISIICLIIVSSSFSFYSYFLDFSNSIKSIIFEKSNFFNIVTSNIADIPENIIMSLTIFIISFLTLILLISSLLLSNFGIVLFPIGIFMISIELLNPYGKFLIEISLLSCFIPLIVSLFISLFSRISSMSLFSEHKLMVLASLFFIINIIIIMLLFSTIFKKR